MSISSILSSSLTGILTNQTALRTVSNNIANVNTEGYARQVVRQENVVVGGRSAGVKITNVERIVDRFLEAAGLNASSAAAYGTVKSELHDRLQAFLGRPDSTTNLAARLDQLFASFSELSLDPSDQIRRQATLASFQDVTDEISRLANEIQSLRADVNQRIADQVSSANQALRRIHELNPLIVRQKILGGEVAGLESQRAQALNDLAKIVDIRTTDNGDGSISITTTAGATLLDKNLRELDYRAPGTVTAETRFPSIDIYRIDSLSGERIGVPEALDPKVGGGTLKGLLELRDQDLRNLSLSLGELASGLIDEFNRVHNAHSAVPAPNQLVGRQTFIDGAYATGFTGAVTFAVLDANNQVVATSTVDFDAAPPADFNALVAQVNADLGGTGTLSLTNGVMSLTAADPSNGVVITDDPTNPSDRAGKGFSQFFGMNDLLEANVEGNYDTGLTGTENHNLVAGGQTTFEVRDATGTVLRQYTLNAVGTTFNDLLADLNAPGALGDFLDFSLDANGALQIADQPGFQDLNLFVISDTSNVGGTGVTLSSLFGIGDKYTVDAARTLRINPAIANDPGLMATASFDGAAAIGEVALGVGDESGALALFGLQSAIVDFDAAGELSEMSTSLSQYSAAFLANAGLMAARADATAEDNSALLTEIQARITDVSGVNLDEELANMVTFQNAFNASARLITTAQNMFDALLASVGLG